MLNFLKIGNFRNLENLGFQLSSGINIFFGKNGSGKTSILEAVFFLSRGKSFRTRYAAKIIKSNSNYFQITGQLGDGSIGQHSLEVFCSKEKRRFTVDKASISKASDIIEWLPTIALFSESDRVLGGGPKFRREFFDWGVFHVEPKAKRYWQCFFRSLQQRNTLLRSRNKIRGKKTEWDRDLVVYANLIAETRQSYLNRFKPYFTRYCLALLDSSREIDIDYRCGWDIKESLSDSLVRSFESDCSRGFTQVGPHRADYKFLDQGVPVIDYYSRGQQKLVLFALLLAHTSCFNDITGLNSVILLDDLTAELSIDNVEKILVLLDSQACQVLLTVSDNSIPLGVISGAKSMFHVERGGIKKVL